MYRHRFFIIAYAIILVFFFSPIQVKAFSFGQAISEAINTFPVSFESVQVQIAEKANKAVDIYAAVGESIVGDIRTSWNSFLCLITSSVCPGENKPTGEKVGEKFIPEPSGTFFQVVNPIDDVNKNEKYISYVTKTYPTTYINSNSIDNNTNKYATEEFVRGLVRRQAESIMDSESDNNDNNNNNESDLSSYLSLSAYYATTTDSLDEGSNLFFTDARVDARIVEASSTIREMLSSDVDGISYASGTGILSLTSGYNIPLTASTTNWDNFFTTPSVQITAGTGLSWNGNTLNSTLTSSQWTTNIVDELITNDIYYNTGNIGIGLTSPAYMLDVAGSVNTASYFSVNGSTRIDSTNMYHSNTELLSDGSNLYANSLALGSNSVPRGYFDINNYVLESQTVDDVTGSGVIYFNTMQGAYYNTSNQYEYHVYAYRNIGAQKVFSVTPLIVTGTENADGMYFYTIDFDWDSVSGADGYRVVVAADPQYGASGDYFFDTNNTSVSIEGGFDSYSSAAYAYDSSVIVTPTQINMTIGADMYIDSSSGNLISANGWNVNNTSGVYTYLASTTWGLDTNANISANDYYINGSLIGVSHWTNDIGYVNSVVGSSNRITSSGGTNPVIDIANTYTGQTSINTLGTITTGVWSGSTLAVNKGGTNLTSYAVGDLLYASGATTLAKLADVAAGSVLVSGGVGIAPSYSSSPTITGLLVGTGSVGTPAIRFSTDTNTGIYSSGADNFDITTGGVQRLNINSNGDFKLKNKLNVYTISRTLPVAVNGVVDIGSFTTGIFAGGSMYRITITHGQAGSVISRYYEIPTQYQIAGSSGWRIVPYKGVKTYDIDYDLDINLGGGGVGVNQFRLRKVSSASTATLSITIEQIGTEDTFTASTATSSVSAPTSYLGTAGISTYLDAGVNLAAFGVNASSSLPDFSMSVAGKYSGGGTGGLKIDSSNNSVFDGDLGVALSRSYPVTRTLPTTVGDEVDIGTFTFPNGSGNMDVWITVDGTGYSQAKRYFLSFGYNATGGVWQKVIPISTTGAYIGNDLDLEVFSNNSNMSLRMRRVLGSTAANAYVTIVSQRDTVSNFTPSTATNTVSAPTATYQNTSLTQLNGNVGIGSSTPYSKLSVGGGDAVIDGFTKSSYFIATSTTATSTFSGGLSVASSLYVMQNGNVGIGSSTPVSKFSVDGTVSFANLNANTGAGSLCLTAGNEVVYNSASDSCLPSLRDTKHDITDIDINALEIIKSLKPVSFVYNQGNERTRYGFIAEDTSLVNANLATYNNSGDITGIDDRAVLSVLVKAVQEIWNSMKSIALWFSTDGNKFSIQGQICVDDVCVTKEQFKNLLINAGAAVVPTQVPTPDVVNDNSPATSTDPVIVVDPIIIEEPVVVPEPEVIPEPVVVPEPEVAPTE